MSHQQHQQQQPQRHFMGVGWLGTLLGAGGAEVSKDTNSGTGGSGSGGGATGIASLYAGRGLDTSLEFDAINPALLSESSVLCESANFQDLRVSIDDSKEVLGGRAALSLSREEFTIFVKTFTQKRLEVTVTQALTVLELKERIALLERVPVERQKLLVDGQKLEDSQSLAVYKLTANAVVHLVMALA
jgi:hypothetical protein